jgi:hypothetical protein
MEEIPLLSSFLFLRFWNHEIRHDSSARKRVMHCSWSCDISNPKIVMPDQAQKNRPYVPGPSGGGEGPSAPRVEKPNTDELLKRMRKVDPDQAKRYRQRTGQ